MPFPLEPRFLDQTEQKLGLSLPATYRAAMLHENGGEVFTDAAAEQDGVAWFLHPIFDDSDRKRLARTCNDVCRETGSARSQSGFPADAVTIATDGGGNHLVLLPDPDARDRLGEPVFDWDHETGTLEQVASSFEALRR